MKTTKVKLSKEQETIQLLASPILTEQQEKRLEHLLLQDMDYPYILGLLHLHRIEGMAWNNIKEKIIGKRRNFKFGFLFKMLQRYQKIQYLYFNEQKVEIDEVIKILNRNNIPYLILKGMSVADHVYFVPGIRISNDCDVLVHPDYLQSAVSAFENEGYIQGYYDSYKHEIVEATRKEKITSVMRSHETIPLKKISSSFKAMNHFTVDIQYTVDLMTSNRTNEILDEFFSRRIYLKNLNEYYPALSWEDSLIFLCIHFYVEATVYDEVQNYKDFTIYKLLDIYMMLLSKESQIDFDKIVQFALKHRLEKPIYFTFYYLSLFFEVNFDFINKLNISDDSFLDQVIKKDKVIHVWTTERITRFFDFNRIGKLNEKVNN